MMRSLFIILMLSLFTTSFAQTDNAILANKVQEVHSLLMQLRSAHVDSLLNRYNREFNTAFGELLQLKGAFDYPFTSFHKSVGDIRSEDGLVRIFSWNVQMTNKEQHYYAYVLKQNNYRKNKITVTELHATTQNFQLIKNSTIHPDTWYGALYYKIIDVNRGGKTYYTLLGYGSKDLTVNTKLIDILTFKRDEPSLGYPIFETKNKRDHSKRILFQYSHQATMSLKYDPERKLIIFDHLSPQTPSLKGMYAYYTPDFSYDAFAWNGRVWELKQDIIAVNKKKSDIVKLRVFDYAKDSVVTIQKKEKWINPSNPNAPIDNGQHRALTPEMIQKEGEKAEKQKSQQKNDKKYREYKGHHYTNYGKKP